MVCLFIQKVLLEITCMIIIYSYYTINKYANCLFQVISSPHSPCTRESQETLLFQHLNSWSLYHKAFPVKWSKENLYNRQYPVMVLSKLTSGLTLCSPELCRYIDESYVIVITNYDYNFSNERHRESLNCLFLLQFS